MIANAAYRSLPSHLVNYASSSRSVIITSSRVWSSSPKRMSPNRSFQDDTPSIQSSPQTQEGTHQVVHPPNMKAHDIQIRQEDIQSTNEQYRGILEIKPSTYGKGLFALQDFHLGDFIMSATAQQITPTKNSHTVQTGFRTHALMDLPASLINHKCSANVGAQDNMKGGYDWYAMTDIAKGEELFADYETFEYEIDGFDCSCGSPVCRGTLQGFRGHQEQLLKQYDEKYIASYLKEQTGNKC